MKTNVNYKKYGKFPDMDTVKEIILYGAENGKEKKQFMFKNFDGEVETKNFNQVYYDTVGLGEYLNIGLNLTGKKVAILSENSYYWIACFYAISTSKMTAIPLDSKLRDEDLTDIMVRSGCDAIIYSKEFSSAVYDMKNNSQTVITEYILMNDFDSLVENGHNLLNSGKKNYIEDEVFSDDIGYIVYTSGTTGKSKGVMLTQKNVASDGIATCRAMTGNHTVAFLPFHHTLSWASALLASPLLCEWGYLCPSIKNLQNDIALYKPQNLTAVPLAVEMIYKRIWMTAKKEGKEELLNKGLKISRFLMKLGIDVRRKIFKEVIDNLGGNLEVIICGGAYLDPKYEKGLYDLGIQVINGYGATECAPTVTCNRLDDFKFGSAGKPLECNEIKINNADEEGVGEIYVKGSNVMAGYYNDLKASAEAFDNGWYSTGDYGYLDKDGFLFFRGRNKNLIVLNNGKNVSPEELEDKLSSIDYVIEVIVYEEDGFITGEFFLDTDKYPDAKNTIKNDVNTLNKKLPSFKQITKIKIRDEEFPKTTTLKIKRKY